MKHLIASQDVETGKIEVHADNDLGVNDTDTLCGLDIRDDLGNADYRSVKLPKGAKINCKQCTSVIRSALRFTLRDIT